MAKAAPVTTSGAGPISIILRGIVWVGHLSAWLILPILLLVVVSVTLSAFKVGILIDWETDIFLFGSKLTLASLGDLQWHLFGIMLLLSLSGALINNRHVRVDFFRQYMSARTKAVIDLLGHLVLLMPLACIICWHGYDFAVRSFHMGEGSDYDGLYDRFFIKSFLSIGFALLAIAGICLIVQRLQELFRKPDDAS